MAGRGSGLSVHRVDQGAGRDVSQRDGIVTRQLETQQFPNATFPAAARTVPASVTSSPVDVTLPGKLTIHGVTKDVTATAHAQVVGDKIEIAGTLVINMADYGVSPPRAPFVTVDPTATIEFDVFLSKSYTRPLPLTAPSSPPLPPHSPPPLPRAPCP